VALAQSPPSPPKTTVEPPAPSGVPNTITGAKVLRCHDHECVVLTCREGKCIETERLVPQK
jgi:hypothetical protein